MEFSHSPAIAPPLRKVDAVVAREISVPQMENDDDRVFDHGRKWAGSDFNNGSLRHALPFLHETDIRQTACSVGAGPCCIKDSIDCANGHNLFGRRGSANQAMAVALVELNTAGEMARWPIYGTAAKSNRMSGPQIQLHLLDKVSMCNHLANRLLCEAADQAIQHYGGIAYSRHQWFEHIHHHLCQYRLTKDYEEPQMPNAAGHLFGVIDQNRGVS